jgi:RND family efflux transporter MFP subunit
LSFRFSTTLALIAGGLLFASPGMAQSPGELIEKGFTKPSSCKELSFAFQGVIAKVEVKEGELVKAGQTLMTQDELIESTRLRGLKLEADRSLVVKAKEATLANKQVVLKRKQELFNKRALSESELQEAQLDVVLAEAEVELERYQGTVKAADVDLQTVRLDRMKLVAPTDGVVEKINLTAGEVADIDKPSVVLLDNDPLYIEVRTLPTSVVQSLKPGQELQVRYPREGWKPAIINQVAAEADARSGTQAIRLELANPEKRSSGLQMEVKIPSVPQTAER